LIIEARAGRFPVDIGEPMASNKKQSDAFNGAWTPVTISGHVSVSGVLSMLEKNGYLELQETNDGYVVFPSCREYAAGQQSGEAIAGWRIAQEMRVLFCALVQLGKKGDSSAYWAMVKIIQNNLSQYVNFEEEDWAIFRGDWPKKKMADATDPEAATDTQDAS
jgi:hypothetical protein